nr:hypothetical protein CFP56_00570 [Quercus suber]
MLSISRHEPPPEKEPPATLGPGRRRPLCTGRAPASLQVRPGPVSPCPAAMPAHCTTRARPGAVVRSGEPATPAADHPSRLGKPSALSTARLPPGQDWTGLDWTGLDWTCTRHRETRAHTTDVFPLLLSSRHHFIKRPPSCFPPHPQADLDSRARAIGGGGKTRMGRATTLPTATSRTIALALATAPLPDFRERRQVARLDRIPSILAQPPRRPDPPTSPKPHRSQTTPHLIPSISTKGEKARIAGARDPPLWEISLGKSRNLSRALRRRGKGTGRIRGVFTTHRTGNTSGEPRDEGRGRHERVVTGAGPDAHLMSGYVGRSVVA